MMPSKLGSALLDIVERQSEWSQRTFGKDSERGPTGALDHLTEEVRETKEAYLNLRMIDDGNTRAINVATKHVLLEFADCQILLLDSLRRAGFTLFDLIKAVEEKQGINAARQWPKNADANSPVFHLEPPMSNL